MWRRGMVLQPFSGHPTGFCHQWHAGPPDLRVQKQKPGKAIRNIRMLPKLDGGR